MKAYKQDQGNGETEWNKLEDIHFLRANQAAIAAFFSACFLVFPPYPWNSRSATLTVHLKTGKCPGPCRVVVYTGNDTSALWVHSSATSSCTLLFHPALFSDHQNMKEIKPQKACCSQTPKKSFTQHEHLKWLTHRQDTKRQQLTRIRAARDWKRSLSRKHVEGHHLSSSMLRLTQSATSN